VKNYLTQLIKEIAGRILVHTGLYRARLRGSNVVVAFHSVNEQAAADALRCPPDAFEEYCAFFSRHMTPRTLTEAMDSVDRREEKNAPPVVVTFDDGYLDNFEIALPILKKHGLSATFFVTTGFVGSQTRPSWDEKAGIESRWMSIDNVQSLARHGHSIGCHTVSHCDLETTPKDDLRRELSESIATLESWTNRPIEHFAIPFGRYFSELERTAAWIREEYGFQSISLCRGRVNGTLSKEMIVERIPINPAGYISPYGWMFDVLWDAHH
jgi:peptidoglycan/xylan/chitin deacetylase (PgdA/CDA1 family)